MPEHIDQATGPTASRARARLFSGITSRELAEAELELEWLAEGALEVALVDPLDMSLAGVATGPSATNIYAMGALLQAAAAACLDAGITPILVHHSTKGASKGSAGGDGLDLDDLAQAGVAE